MPAENTDSDDLSDLLSDKHFEAFGRITTAYAAAEVGKKLVLSGILDIHPHEAMILLEPSSSVGLRNAAKSIVKLRLDPDLADRFLQIIGGLKKHSELRNLIAHSRWTRGTRPGSIRPARIEIRQGRADPRGYGAEEPDYTLSEIGSAADELFAVNQRLAEFLTSTGLSDRIEVRTADALASVRGKTGDSR